MDCRVRGMEQRRVGPGPWLLGPEEVRRLLKPRREFEVARVNCFSLLATAAQDLELRAAVDRE